MRMYEKIAEQLRYLINSNSEKGILSLPTEAELCDQYKCSRQTIRHALELLKEEKLIESRQGRGYIVTGLSPAYEQNTVAIVFPRDDDERHYSLLSRLTNPLTARGFHVDVYLHDGDVNKERSILTLLYHKPLRGLIIEPALSYMPSVNADLFEKLQNSCNSIVFVRHRNENLSEFHGVFEKCREGAYSLTQHLIDRNHRNIAALLRVDSAEGHRCFLGYSQAMLDAYGQIPQDRVYWYTTKDHLEIEKEQANGLLRDFVRNRLSPSTAVICQSDVIAYWLIMELKRSRISVPEDVAVVSFGDSYLCKLARPTITSMGYTEDALAEKVLELFDRQLFLKKADDIYLDWKLNERGSS